MCKGQTRLRTTSGAPQVGQRTCAGGGGASRLLQGGAGERGEHRADGVGCEVTGGGHKADVAHLHAAHRQAMVEEAAHTRQDGEAGGAWTGPAWCAGGAGADALRQADEAPVGEGDFADRGRQGLPGGGAMGSGLTVDVPWGVPAVWSDLCKLPGGAYRWCKERAGER